MDTDKEKDVRPFFHYEQSNLNPRSTFPTPFNDYGNFAFPNVTG